ncbi:biotin--[acetyl-CoA-carboxylase] ligase [Flavobacterium sp. '19STA2R22 D10 B1']|uniref:biotin--[acetyl-CoA-carboxylase] ligase n=1 Tax=Flavobacterium aerium TaxID=3037261 RepID=UPI00278C3997|nr:biotin--[acetyl-CoA-carboxylase] ligase [Flavobacterium sp. '19STA2R22 D10 B1']
MELIKLDAIDSTNDYLKRLIGHQIVENYTIVSAENQTNGKGQMGSKWAVEAGKNLTMSILVRDLLLDLNAVFNLNIAVALGVIEALEFYNIPKLSIKWPNDILSDTKKLGGILIENLMKSDREIYSIIGIGLNVNQVNFQDLPKATSLSVVQSKEFDKEELLYKIVVCVKNNVTQLMNNDCDTLWQKYNNKLFRKGIPMPFQYKDGIQFMGIIQGVHKNGRLEILMEDDRIQQFEIKEIQMLY